MSVYTNGNVTGEGTDEGMSTNGDTVGLGSRHPIVEEITVADRPISLTLPVKVFKPKSDTITLHYFSAADASRQQGMQADELKDGEIRLACSEYLERSKRTVDNPSEIDGRSFFTFGKAGLGDATASVVIKIFTGNRRPDGLETYKRVVCRNQGAEKCSVRWCRVQSLTSDDPGDLVDVKRGSQQLGHEFEELTIRVPRRVKEVKLRELVAASGDKNNSQGANKALAAVNAVLKAENSVDEKHVLVQRNKYFSDSAQASIHGIDFHTGVTKTLRLTDPNIVLTEKLCHRLFFPATSVARFIDSHMGKSGTTDNVCASKYLTSLMKGVRVKILGTKHNWTKTITGFSDKTPDQQKTNVPALGVEIRLQDYYCQDGYSLTHPTLPSVDLGSTLRPYYVPPELCSILPHQSFTHAGGVAFQRELGLLRSRLSIHGGEGNTQTTEVGRADSLKTTIHGHFHYSKGANWRQSSMKPAHILLVEAGTIPLRSREWTEFQEVLDNMSRRAYSEDDVSHIARVEKHVLALPYTKADSCLEDWIIKLEQRIRDMEADRKSVVVLFGLENNAYRPKIFELMKTACNERRLGVQSIGINLATICRELNSDTLNGLLRYTDQIYRKMFARTPEKVRLNLMSNQI